MSISPSHRYSDDKLRSFRELIVKKLKKVHQEADTLKSRLDELEARAGGTVSSSYGEQGTSQENREFITRQYQRLAENIKELELALARIANKTYGIDEKTGELIDEKRLFALPTARTAI